MDLSFRNLATMPTLVPCPAGQRIPVVLPWSDWSASGTAGKTARLTSGSTTFPAFGGRRVARNTRLFYFDAPPMLPGLLNSGNPSASTLGPSQNGSIDVVSRAQYQGNFLPADPLAAFLGGGNVTCGFGGTTANVAWHRIDKDDEFEAMYVATIERSITLNGRSRKFWILAWLILTASSTSKKTGETVYPRAAFKAQITWSDPTDPGTYVSHPDNPAERWNLGELVPALSFTFPSGFEVAHVAASKLSIQLNSNIITLTGSDWWADGETHAFDGDVFSPAIASTDEVTQWAHWKVMPPEAIGNRSTMLPFFDDLTHIAPELFASRNTTWLNGVQEDYHKRLLMSLVLGNEARDRYTCKNWIAYTNPQGPSKQNDFGIHKLGILWLGEKGNTTVQNVWRYALHGEFVRPLDLRTTAGKPMSWEEFPEGEVTAANAALINDNPTGNYPRRPIQYYAERQKEIFAPQNWNTLGKVDPTIEMWNGSQWVTGRAYEAYPAARGNWVGYLRSHVSKNIVTALYKLTGCPMLKRRLRISANAYLFENKVYGGAPKSNGNRINNIPSGSYTSEPEQTRCARMEHAAAMVLQCLYGPETRNAAASTPNTPLPQFERVDDRATDDFLREAILDRFERIALPLASDFNHYGLLKRYIQSQKSKRWHAFCPVWGERSANNLPLNWNFYDMWQNCLAAPGWWYAYQSLKLFRSTSPAIPEWRRIMLWALQTWIRWGIYWGTHKRWANNPESAALSESAPGWQHVKGIKQPTTPADRDMQYFYMFGELADGNGVSLNFDVTPTEIQSYIDDPWPETNGNTSYREKWDGGRDGCRIAYTGHQVPNGCSGRVGTGPEPGSIYLARTYIKHDNFLEWYAVGARIALSIAREIIDDTSADADERAVAVPMEAKLVNYEQHLVAAYEAEPDVAGTNPFIEFAIGRTLDFQTIDPYETSGGQINVSGGIDVGECYQLDALLTIRPLVSRDVVLDEGLGATVDVEVWVDGAVEINEASAATSSSRTLVDVSRDVVIDEGQAAYLQIGDEVIVDVEADTVLEEPTAPTAETTQGIDLEAEDVLIEEGYGAEAETGVFFVVSAVEVNEGALPTVEQTTSADAATTIVTEFAADATADTGQQPSVNGDIEIDDGFAVDGFFETEVNGIGGIELNEGQPAYNDENLVIVYVDGDLVYEEPLVAVTAETAIDALLGETLTLESGAEAIAFNLDPIAGKDAIGMSRMGDRALAGTLRPKLPDSGHRRGRSRGPRGRRRGEPVLFYYFEEDLLGDEKLEES